MSEHSSCEFAEIKCLFPLETTIDHFAKWLANYESLDPWGIRIDNDRLYSLSELKVKRRGNCLLLSREAVLEVDYYIEQLERENPMIASVKALVRDAEDLPQFVQFTLKPLDPKRIEISAYCSGPMLADYFQQLLAQIARYWPSITEHLCKLSYTSKEKFVEQNVSIAEFCTMSIKNEEKEEKEENEENEEEENEEKEKEEKEKEKENEEEENEEEENEEEEKKKKKKKEEEEKEEKEEEEEEKKENEEEDSRAEGEDNISHKLDPISSDPEDLALKPWEQIEDHGYDRHLVRLIHERPELSYKDIAQRIHQLTGKKVSASRLASRASELRRKYGSEIVPERKRGRKEWK